MIILVYINYESMFIKINKFLFRYLRDYLEDRSKSEEKEREFVNKTIEKRDYV